LNDLELSRDLVLLFSLIGKPVTYKIRKKSQTIYLQHAKSKIKKGNGWLNNPILAERVPGWMAVSTTKVPGLAKSRMVGLNTLEKYNAHTQESLKIKNSDIYLVRVKETKIRRYKKLKEFYDIELERNHLFVHSLGQISFNCCRLRLDLTQLYNRGGGGLFGSGSKTGSIGVVTINLPRIGYLSKTKKEFFERLAKVMDLAKESLEIKSASRLGPTLIGGIINAKAVSKAAYRIAVEEGRDIIIVMAGKVGIFYLEDFIGAGLIVKELENYNIILDDVATAALNLVKNSNWRGLAERSEHASYLASIGFKKDVIYALTPSISNTVPILTNSIITKLEDKLKTG
jgi:hypothetical protein